jgi:hypothetical protein
MSGSTEHGSGAEAAATHDRGVADAGAPTSPSATQDGPDSAVLTRWARRGIWLLPVYALLLALSTVTHQPDYTTDFAGYSRYVTTGEFLASHLVASILGAGLGVVGTVSLAVLLATGRSATPAMLGLACTLVGDVLFTAIFAAAAFAQPAIGQAWLDGAHDVAQSVNSDVYGAPLFATFGVGAPLFIAGAILLGVAVVRRSPTLRWPGIGYAVFLPLFLVSGFLFDLVQPVMAVFLLVATFLIARRLQHAA